VSGAPVEELSGRLRPWALDVLSSECLHDGEYWAELVTVDSDGHYDQGVPLEVVDIFWFYGEEFVAASSVP
jgi:hypothetical protein